MKKVISEKWMMGLLPLLAASCGTPTEKAAMPEKPNLVFILVDDMGYGDISCFGQKTLSTPNIDKLAGEVLEFVLFLGLHYSQENTLATPAFVETCLRNC